MSAMTLLAAPPVTRVNGHTHQPTVPEARPEPLRGAWTVLGALIGVMAALIALGGMVLSFRAVSVEMVPAFGAWAFLVPIVTDLTVFVFSGVDLLLARLDMGHPLARWMVYGATGGTVFLNYSAGASAAGRVAHVLMPSIWVVFVELMRHVVRERVGLVTGSRRQPIPAARWLLSPWPTFKLWRRMVLWRVNSYPDALAVERRRLGAVAGARAVHGWLWRWRVSPLLRLEIGLGEVGAEAFTPAPTPEQTPVSVPELPREPLPPPAPPVEPTPPREAPTGERDRASTLQTDALTWVLRNEVMLTDGMRLSLVTDPGAQVGSAPHPRTGYSLIKKGLVAPTPNRPAGLTLEGIRVLLGLVGESVRVAHYRPVGELTAGLVVEFGAAAPVVAGLGAVGLPGCRVVTGPVGLPAGEWVRVVGSVVEGRPALWNRTT